MRKKLMPRREHFEAKYLEMFCYKCHPYPGTLIPSAQLLVWAAKQPLGNAAPGALFA